MNLKTLERTPPWDWPEGASALFLKVLRDAQAAEPERLLAAELAGEIVAINDKLVEALLSILRNQSESERLRARAAISLGPILELADTDGFEDTDDMPITEDSFHKIQETLRGLSLDAGVPNEVRRMILEASVRAEEDWHPDAVRAAFASDDESWKLTAIFCMQYVRGFDSQIVEALKSQDPDVRYHAVRAAGNWGVEAAWPEVSSLVLAKKTAKPLLLAAIEAVAAIRPEEAPDLLEPLLDADDEEIVEAVRGALVMAEGCSAANREDDEDEEGCEDGDEDDDELLR